MYPPPIPPGLTSFQQKDKLKTILSCLSDIRTSRPLFIKISPQLSDKDISNVVEMVKLFNLQGIIATNTLPIPEQGKGGCSGRLLRESSESTRKKVLEQLKETPFITVIGCGGIENIDDLTRFWKQGGRVVQIYTALIYGGPGMLGRIQRDIVNFLEQSGAPSLQDWIDHLPSP